VDKGLLEQLPYYLPSAATVLVAILAYVFGRRQTEHERLYTRRAEVIAELFKRFKDVDERVYELLHPIGFAGEPDKSTKAKLATEAFNELQAYYQRHSIWLSRRTSRQMQAFIAQYRVPVRDFPRWYEDRTDPDVPAEDRSIQKWVGMWERFEQTSPDLRAALEEEFRAALGDRRAKIALLWRSPRSNRNDHGS
jgi:hypothetical protein